MCSNISTETTRSKGPPAGAKVFMSQVTMVRLARPSRRASPSMCSFWVRELETPVIRARGKRRAR